MQGLTLARPLVILDCETTGVDLETDRLVSLALQIFRPGGADPERRDRLFYPECPIPPEATAVHGITDEDVRDRPRFRRCARDLASLLSDVDFGGYNVRFDLQILMREFELASMPIDMQGACILDGYKLWLAMRPRSLADAVRAWTGLDPEGAHEATRDVDMTVAVLQAQIAVAARIDDYLTDGAVDLRKLHEAAHPGMVDLDGKFEQRDGEIFYRFGKYRGKKVADCDPGFLEWMLAPGRGFSVHTLQVADRLLREIRSKRAGRLPI